MIAQTNKPAASRAIRDEHVRLGDIVDSVRHSLAARQVHPARMAALIEELADYVLEHFRHEEEGGYFAAALDLAPRLSPRAEDLLRDHRELTAQLASLRELAAGGSRGAQWWQRLEEEFARFLERFHAHEAAEDVLLQDAYSDDIGAKD